jgi:hypothetical protein
VVVYVWCVFVGVCVMCVCGVWCVCVCVCVGGMFQLELWARNLTLYLKIYFLQS